MVKFGSHSTHFKIKTCKPTEHFVFLCNKQANVFENEFKSTLTNGSKRGYLEPVFLSDTSWNAFRCAHKSVVHDFRTPVFYFNFQSMLV